MLYYDIYLMICNSSVLSYTDLHKLKCVNKVFFKIINNALKVRAYNTLRKWLTYKNRCNESNLYIKRFKMVKNNTYSYNIIQDVSLNNTPTQIVKATEISPFRYRLDRYGEIISSIIVKGNNIKKIQLEIGGMIVWQSWYLDAKLINIVPFINGIIILAAQYCDINLIVYADSIDYVYSNQLSLAGTDPGTVARNAHIFNYDFVYNNMRFDAIIYQYGRIRLRPILA